MVPCHRVLAAGGKLGGFSANGGIATKLRLLVDRSARANAAARPCSRATAFSASIRAAAVEHLRASDAALARVIDAVGPFRMRLKSTPSIFVALAEAIVYQQLTGKAAATIFATRVRAFPRAHEGPTAEQILRASDEKLRSAGLSRAEAALVARPRGQGCQTARSHPRRGPRMEDEAIVERLTEVRGIGRWTVEMLLMFRLGRPDVLPADDYGIRKGFAVAFKKRELPGRDRSRTAW